MDGIMSEGTLTGATAAAPGTEQNTPAATPPADGGAAPNAGGNPDADKSQGGETKKADEKPAGAPEKYEDFALPEGVELDPAAMEKFLPVAKELNLSQEQAQKLVDLQTEMVKNADEAARAAVEKQWTEWADAARADTEFGGANFKSNLGVANKAIDAFGSKALREALDLSGLGNHPEFLRFAWKVGKAVSEDKMHVQNSQGAAKPKSAAELLYPTMNQ